MAAKRAIQKSKKRTVLRAGRTRAGEQTATNIENQLLNSETSYERALLRNIVDGKKGKKTTEFALMFNYILSNLTKSMRDLYYKEAFSIGRALYQLYTNRRRYIWPEESIADLVSFFEKAGFERISYNVFPDIVRINIHNRESLYLGMNIHLFEAGIIAGFLTAAKVQLVHVDEVSCLNNNGDACRFVSSTVPLTHSQTVNEAIINRLVENMPTYIQKAEKRMQSASNDYYVLSSMVLHDREYIDAVKKIMMHLGTETGRRMRLSKSNLERTINLLNFGNPNVKSVKPLNVEISFDRSRSKREFIETSVAFVEGLLGAQTRGGIEMEVVSSKKSNTYRVRLFERKTQKEREM